MPSLNDVKYLREQIERDILKAVQEFERACPGASVAGINLTCEETIGDRARKTIAVQLRVELP